MKRCVSNFTMCLLSNLIILFGLSLLAQTGLSQSGAKAKLSETDEDRSFYLNQPIFHPETLSGIWETPNGNGGAVGIHLQLATKLLDDGRIPWGVSGEFRDRRNNFQMKVLFGGSYEIKIV